MCVFLGIGWWDTRSGFMSNDDSQASGRSTAAGDAPLLFQLQLPGRFMEQAATSGGQGRVAAEVAVPRQMFAEILSLIAQLQAPPAPA